MYVCDNCFTFILIVSLVVELDILLLLSCISRKDHEQRWVFNYLY